MLHVHLVLGSEQVNVLHAVGRVVLDGPRADDEVLVGRLAIAVVARGEEKARLGSLYLRPIQIRVAERRALHVQHTLGPQRYLQQYGQVLVEFVWRQQNDVEI